MEKKQHPGESCGIKRHRIVSIILQEITIAVRYATVTEMARFMEEQLLTINVITYKEPCVKHHLTKTTLMRMILLNLMHAKHDDILSIIVDIFLFTLTLFTEKNRFLVFVLKQLFNICLDFFVFLSNFTIVKRLSCRTSCMLRITSFYKNKCSYSNASHKLLLVN